MHLELYLHFPFCVHKCLYCDFCSAPETEDTIRRYCLAVCKELKSWSEKLNVPTLDTVFLGGGTPSLLPPDCLQAVFETLHQYYSLSPKAEITSEANPGTISRQWIETAKYCGINRISLGMQSSDDTILKSLGRIHTFKDVCNSADMIHSAGINNLNLDLMFGLPGQSTETFLNTILQANELQPSHISSYSLTPEEGTPLYNRLLSGELTLPDEDITADQYELGRDLLEKLEYHQYEISNFAKTGYACRHNTGYWQGAWYLGVGTAAHSMLPPKVFHAEHSERIRLSCETSTEDFIRHILNGNGAVYEKEDISRSEAMYETVMLSLRTVTGINETAFQRDFKISLCEYCNGETENIIRSNLAFRYTRNGMSYFALTPKGMEIQNTILTKLLPE